MYLCICKAVSDRTIRHGIAGGAHSVRALKDQFGVGACCGRCIPEIRALLAERVEQTAPLRCAPAEAIAA